MHRRTAPTPRPPEAVFAAIGDGWLLGTWLPGAKRIQAVDAAWPATGSAIRHGSGLWPLLVSSETRVQLLEEPTRFVILTRRALFGTTVVDISVTRPSAFTTLVAVRERGVSGPARFAGALLRVRSLEIAQRLAWLSRRERADVRL